MTGAGTEKGTLFTPESANRALSYVRAVVKDLVETAARRKAAEREQRRTVGEPSRRAREEADRAGADLDRIRRELESVGVQVKDELTGLVDFPAEIGGKRVLLCWRHGEERVAHWHDLQAGFPGRRPLGPADANSA